MKLGAENRRKTIIAGSLGAVALVCVVYMYNALFGGSSPTPPPSVAPIAAAPATNSKPAAPAVGVTGPATKGASSGGVGLGAAPGVAATKLASTSSSLDPTLDETAMLRTESLVYSGTGRNIFSAIYTPPPPPMPKNVPSARPKQPAYVPPPQPTGPPPPPPINLKFFGTAKRQNGVLQAFLLQGENVYLASPGDIVARKYRIERIDRTSIQVTDLQNNNTQTLPLQMN
jgi:hypothetical protein